MITRRTKIQLLAFVVITLLGVSYVGAKYARLDRVFIDDSYVVQAHFADSGGIFAGAEVTYRGRKVGTVDRLEVTPQGVDVFLDIDNEFSEIPSDARALVANKSAVGEQYVDLQPQSDDGPYFEDGSEIAVGDTATPIPTETLLGNLSRTVASVDQEALRTTVTELGAAFGDAGDDLQRIIDSGNNFINAADENFDITVKLIRDSNTVLNTQIASESDLRTFANQLSLFSTTLAGADPDLRKVIEDGSFAANQLRSFIREYRVDLSKLLNNLVTTGEIIVKRLPGIEQVLVIYPYIIEGSFGVVTKSPGTGLFDAHFGLIITNHAPCFEGYNAEERNPESERFGNPDMDVNARCTEGPQVNSRGEQNIPPRAPADYDAPTVASYDPDTGKLDWSTDQDLATAGSVAPPSLGEESWKWLYLQPMMGQ